MINVGLRQNGLESSAELCHEHCHGISLPHFLRPQCHIQESPCTMAETDGQMKECFTRRVTPCAVKTGAVRPVFAWAVGELRAADPKLCSKGAVKQTASPGGTIRRSETQVEAGAGAAHRTGKPGQSAHAESTQGVFL